MPDLMKCVCLHMESSTTDIYSPLTGCLTASIMTMVAFALGGAGPGYLICEGALFPRHAFAAACQAARAAGAAAAAAAAAAAEG